MNERAISGGTTSAISILVLFTLALPAGCLIPGHASAADQSAAAVDVQRHGRHFVASTSLEERANALSQVLDLDAEQQAELKKILGSQRSEVRRIWGDTSVPAAYRVSATQAVSDRTADQIRAMLNEEQRKKYNPPKPPHEALAGSTPSVESWMDATRTK